MATIEIEISNGDKYTAPGTQIATYDSKHYVYELSDYYNVDAVIPHVWKGDNKQEILDIEADGAKYVFKSILDDGSAIYALYKEIDQDKLVKFFGTSVAKQLFSGSSVTPKTTALQVKVPK